jgi:dihydroneopterin aldolase
VDTITIEDLAVLCHIGVPEEERANAQRLLISVSVSGDFSKACRSDQIADTVNYFDLSRRIVEFCRSQSFRLIEKLAHELSRLTVIEFHADAVSVTVKKFILSDARYVSFQLQRDKSSFAG